MMPRRPTRWLVLACAGAALCSLALAAGGTVDGRWRLVEQTYGRGRAQSAEGTPDLRLEFSREAGSARVWVDGREARAAAWPAAFVDHEPIPVRVLERSFSTAGDQVVARYETHDAANEQTILEITEEYRLTEDGAALVGRVTVRERQDGRDAGAYVLQRRFERER